MLQATDANVVFSFRTCLMNGSGITPIKICTTGWVVFPGKWIIGSANRNAYRMTSHLHTMHTKCGFGIPQSRKCGHRFGPSGDRNYGGYTSYVCTCHTIQIWIYGGNWSPFCLTGTFCLDGSQSVVDMSFQTARFCTLRVHSIMVYSVVFILKSIEFKLLKHHEAFRALHNCHWLWIFINSMLHEESFVSFE